MAPQIAHACALAKYTDLFKEIDLAPDVLSLFVAKSTGNDELEKYIREHKSGLWNRIGNAGDYLEEEVKKVRNELDY